MARHRHLDDHTADRLLSGTTAADDAPPGFAGVAAHLEAMASPAAPRPLDGELLAAMVAATTAPDVPRRKSMIAKLLNAKIAAAAIGAVVLSGTGVAAAAGGLPDPVQDKVASVASHVGVDLPDSASSTAKAVHAVDVQSIEPGSARGKAVSDAAHAANEKRKAAHEADKASTDDATKDDDATDDGTAKSEAGKAKAAEHKAAAEQKKADAEARRTEATDDTKTEAETEAPETEAPETEAPEVEHGQSGQHTSAPADHQGDDTTGD
jgi:hypothetical protein